MIKAGDREGQGPSQPSARGGSCMRLRMVYLKD